MNLNQRVTTGTTLIVVGIVGFVITGIWLWRNGEARLDSARAELSTRMFDARHDWGYTDIRRMQDEGDFIRAGAQNADALAERLHGKKLAELRRVFERAQDSLAAFDREYPRVRARMSSTALQLEACYK